MGVIGCVLDSPIIQGRNVGACINTLLPSRHVGRLVAFIAAGESKDKSKSRSASESRSVSESRSESESRSASESASESESESENKREDKD